jgi:nucleoside-specific outer membrane channel protein Tsx
MKFTRIAALCALVSTATLVQAKPVWQDFSFTGLYGENYAHPVGMVDDLEQSTITAEYAAGFKYGDLFIFADRTNNDLSGNETYFEVAPRLSLGAVTGHPLAVGPIKDVLVSTTWEAGKGFNNYLYGIGFALDIPYTKYANINFYKADNDGAEDDYQITLTYAVPVKIGTEEFLADAFLDWSTAEKDGHASEFNWTAQYKWNLGKHISPETRLYLGIEHSVWNNKYTIKGLDENNVSALVKYHF